MKLDGCTALITGASAGLGSEFARQLAPRARAVILVARRQERLEQLRTELADKFPALQIHVRAVDLSTPQAMADLTDWLERKALTPDFLINNAGLGDRGDFATSDLQRVNEMMQVNIGALTLLTRRLLPAMVRAKRGAILHVSSSASFMPMPSFAVYAATKAYVTSFSEALRGEVRRHGITVSALCPGPVHTEFGAVAARAGDRQDLGPDFVYVDAAQVVRDALAGIEQDRAIVIPGAVMKVGMFITRLIPRPLLRLAFRFAR